MQLVHCVQSSYQPFTAGLPSPGLTCHDVLRRRVAIGADDTGGDVCVAPHRALLGQAEVGELGIEVLLGHCSGVEEVRISRERGGGTHVLLC